MICKIQHLVDLLVEVDKIGRVDANLQISIDEDYSNLSSSRPPPRLP
jgi:hypothetical protein